MKSADGRTDQQSFTIDRFPKATVNGSLSNCAQPAQVVEEHPYLPRERKVICGANVYLGLLG